MNLTRLKLCTVGLSTLAVLTACGSPRDKSATISTAQVETSTANSTFDSSASTSTTSEWLIPWIDIVDDTTMTSASEPNTPDPPRPKVSPPPTTPPSPTFTWPTTPPSTTPLPTSPKEYTLTCWDGRTYVQWWPPNDDDRLLLCGPTPPTTLPPPPKVTQISATFGNGLSWLGGGRIATPESCPTSTTIRYIASIADGSSETGSVMLSATEGIYAYAPVTLRGGQQITFSIYLIPGGGCIRGILY